MARPIYVERFISASMDALWNATQSPKVHERWDLRFSEISYIPRAAETEPQRFLYATRIGFGMRITGAGESVGTAERNGDRTSALRFWSDDRKSLIRKGSGYWRYAPTEAGIRFITLYDYETRFGLAGRALDLVFRPLLGWATAWSFDRLRLWLERGAKPETTLERSTIHWIGRGALVLIWLYHGIVPKLFAPAGEVDLSVRTGVTASLAPTFVIAAAVVEIALALGLLVARDPRRLLALSSALAIGLALVTGARIPELLVAPFQPVTLGVAMVGLAAVAFRSYYELPAARNCLRKAPPK
ncbi:MAG TPA: DoxX-like family protein [Candidatus Bathyarchaeia archaeon]|nr:DoxX-like family protein [Candidatus Bathyarchaeia archaeon]